MIDILGNIFLCFLACFLLTLRNTFIDIRSKPACNLEGGKKNIKTPDAEIMPTNIVKMKPNYSRKGGFCWWLVQWDELSAFFQAGKSLDYSGDVFLWARLRKWCGQQFTQQINFYERDNLGNLVS